MFTGYLFHLSISVDLIPVHFVNNMLPPHNVIVENHPELDHEALALLPGEEFDVTFTEAGDYTYWCAPHKGAGMIGTVHVE